VSRETKAAITLAASALGLGIAGDLLFEGQWLGLNVLLWMVAFVLALMVILRVIRAPLHQGRRFMIVPLLVFAAMFAWHASPLLAAANLLAMAAAISMGALRRTQPRLREATLTDYGGGMVAAGCSVLLGAIPLLTSDIHWGEFLRPNSRSVASVVRGLVIGVPLLVVFGALFVAADAVFKQLLTSTMPTLSETLMSRIAVVLVVAWLSGGLLRDLLASREEARVLPVQAFEPFKWAPRLGAIELNVALAALNVLFFMFVVVQFRYLFGGQDLVQRTADLTYAQYARSGFFELVAVAALTLPLLLLGDWLLRGEESGRRRFRQLAAALLVLLGVVIVSALQRMWLYQDQYGLTELRVYATGTILWLALVCLWFGVTVLRGRRHAFAVGALVAGFVATLVLNVINPDSLIARTNVTRPVVDVVYLSQLSDDAVPTLVARLSVLPAEQRPFLAARLLDRHKGSADWRSWNASHAHADHVVAAHRAELERIAAIETPYVPPRAAYDG
jgi:uncharacterized protein DUF4153